LLAVLPETPVFACAQETGVSCPDQFHVSVSSKQHNVKLTGGRIRIAHLVVAYMLYIVQ
jgi:hypothetical protein